MLTPPAPPEALQEALRQRFDGPLPIFLDLSLAGLSSAGISNPSEKIFFMTVLCNAAPGACSRSHATLLPGAKYALHHTLPESRGSRNPASAGSEEQKT